MAIKYLSIIAGGALLALTATASAGPMTVASPNAVTPPAQIEQARYYYHRPHYRHHVWHHYRHYGWRPRHYVWHRGWRRHYVWHGGWRRHYVWHRGWHRSWRYGWYRTRYPHYGYYYGRPYYGYGWNPVGAAAGAAVGLATLPFALAGGWPYY